MAETLSKQHVAVIGGGIAGLAAAAELTRLNIKVTLFEASQYLGGRARGLDYKGVWLDNGQHILLGAYHETLRLLTLANVKESDVLLRLPLQLTMQNLSNKSTFILKACTALPAPLHVLAGFFFASGLNAAEKFAAIRLMFWMKLQRFKIQQDIPLFEFLTARKQPESLTVKLWEPLCIAALNTPIKLASTQIFLNVLRDSFNGKKTDSDLLLPKVDLSELLSKPLDAYITTNGGEIKKNTTVQNIQQTSDCFIVETNTNTEHFSHVVIAVAPHQLKSLKLNTESMAPYTKHFSYQPITTIYLQYPEHVRLHNTMTGITNATSQWLFDRGTLCGQHGLIAVVISANGDHQSLTNTELTEKIIKEVQQLYPQISYPIWTKVITEKRATFSCESSLIKPVSNTLIENLYIVGDFISSENNAHDYPATIEGAVRSGVKCADFIVNS